MHKKHQLVENRLVPRGEGGWGEMKWGSGVSRSKLLYTGWIRTNNKVLLYGTGEYIQQLVRNHNRQKVCICVCVCVCVFELLCCREEIKTTLYIDISIKSTPPRNICFLEMEMATHSISCTPIFLPGGSHG